MVALSALLFCLSCTTAKERVEAAGRIQGQLEASRVLPDYPADCRKYERTGVVLGDRLDVAAIKGDRAVGRGNARIRRCAGWYDGIKAGFAGPAWEQK